MKRFSSLFVFLLFAVSSANVFAVSGTTPVCTSGSLNLVIVNKNLPDDCSCGTHCSSDQKYCLAYPAVSPFSKEVCEDGNGVILFDGYNYSASDSKASSLSLNWEVYDGATKEIHHLTFTTDGNSASVSPSCSDLFGSDVNCVITNSGSEKHKVYTLTLSRNY